MRVAIWVIVGILVVTGVIFFAVTHSQNAKLGGGPITAEEIKSESQRLVKKAEEFAAENKKLQDALAAAGKLNDATRAKLTDLESKISQIHDKAIALATATGKAADDLRKEIAGLTKDYNQGRRNLKKGK